MDGCLHSWHMSVKEALCGSNRGKYLLQYECYQCMGVKDFCAKVLHGIIQPQSKVNYKDFYSKTLSQVYSQVLGDHLAHMHSWLVCRKIQILLTYAAILNSHVCPQDPYAFLEAFSTKPVQFKRALVQMGKNQDEDVSMDALYARLMLHVNISVAVCKHLSSYSACKIPLLKSNLAFADMVCQPVDIYHRVYVDEGVSLQIAHTIRILYEIAFYLTNCAPCEDLTSSNSMWKHILNNTDVCVMSQITCISEDAKLDESILTIPIKGACAKGDILILQKPPKKTLSIHKLYEMALIYMSTWQRAEGDLCRTRGGQRTLYVDTRLEHHNFPEDIYSNHTGACPFPVFSYSSLFGKYKLHTNHVLMAQGLNKLQHTALKTGERSLLHHTVDLVVPECKSKRQRTRADASPSVAYEQSTQLLEVIARDMLLYTLSVVPEDFKAFQKSLRQ